MNFFSKKKNLIKLPLTFFAVFFSLNLLSFNATCRITKNYLFCFFFLENFTKQIPAIHSLLICEMPLIFNATFEFYFQTTINSYCNNNNKNNNDNKNNNNNNILKKLKYAEK